MTGLAKIDDPHPIAHLSVSAYKVIAGRKKGLTLRRRSHYRKHDEQRERFPSDRQMVPWEELVGSRPITYINQVEL